MDCTFVTLKPQDIAKPKVFYRGMTNPTESNKEIESVVTNQLKYLNEKNK